MKQEVGYFQTPAFHVQRPVEPQGKNMPNKTALSWNRDDVLLLLYLSSFIIAALRTLSLTEVACFTFPIRFPWEPVERCVRGMLLEREEILKVFYRMKGLLEKGLIDKEGPLVLQDILLRLLYSSYDCCYIKLTEII